MQGWNTPGHMGRMGIWWIFGAVFVTVVVWALIRTSRRR